MLVSGILDGFLFIAFIVVASLVGKPLSMLNCTALPAASSMESTTLFSSSAYPIRAAVISKSLPYPTFVALDQPTCYEIKAVWGLSIALCVLLAFSSLVCVGLWHRLRREAASAPKDIEG